MVTPPITQQDCPFADLLFMFQVDPNSLDEGEDESLMEHLLQEPPCELCIAESARNDEWLDWVEKIRRLPKRILPD